MELFLEWPGRRVRMSKGKGTYALSPKSGNLKKQPRSPQSRRPSDNTYRDEAEPNEEFERRTKRKQEGRVGTTARATGKGKAAMQDLQMQQDLR